jgi:hypothetical protein
MPLLASELMYIDDSINVGRRVDWGVEAEAENRLTVSQRSILFPSGRIVP